MKTNNALDAFVTKLNPAGSALVYSTFLGGSADERGRSIAVNTAGNAYVTGETESRSDNVITPANNFPTTANAFDAVKTDNTSDAFVTKLNTTGSALDYSTFLGDERQRPRLRDRGRRLRATPTSPDKPTTSRSRRPRAPSTP